MLITAAGRGRPSSTVNLDIPSLLLALAGGYAAAPHDPPTRLLVVLFVGSVCALGLMTSAGAPPPQRPSAPRWQSLILVVGAVLATILLPLFGNITLGTSLSLACGAAILHRCYTPRAPVRHLQIWLAATVMILLSGLERPLGEGMLPLGVWIIATLWVLNGLSRLLPTLGGAREPSVHTAPDSRRTGYLLLPVVLAIAALVMLIAPRREGGLLGHRLANNTAQIGLSESVSFSEMHDLRADNRVAFRLVNPPAWMLPGVARFRVTTFENFSGWRWYRGEPSPGVPLMRDPLGVVAINDTPAPGHEQVTEVILGSHPRGRIPLFERVLGLAGVPADLPVMRAQDGTLDFGGAPGPSSWFYILSRKGDEPPDAIPPSSNASFVPDTLEPIIGQMAGSLPPRVAEQSDEARAAELAAWFRRNGTHTLALGQYEEGPGALEDFVRAGFTGNCELFATALALALRNEGISARLVIGYAGGELAPGAHGAQFVVRQHHAHSWVEAWSPHAGWQTLDPTPWTPYPQVPARDQGVDDGMGGGGTTLLTALVSRLESWNGLSQHQTGAEVGSRLLAALQSFDGGSLWRAIGRLRENGTEWPILLLAVALLALNLIASMLYRRFALRLGLRRFRSGKSSHGFDWSANPLMAELMRRLGGAGDELLPGATGEFFHRAARLLNLGDDAADRLRAEYLLWRFGCADAETRAASARQFLAILRNRATTHPSPLE